MIISELENCCAVGLLSGFYEYSNYKEVKDKKQHILEEMKEFILEYIEDNDDIPTTFFATTNTTTQKPWEDGLQDIGFKARKFRSRHNKPKEKTLNFWSLYYIPNELKPWVKEQLKLQKERIKDDNW